MVLLDFLTIDSIYGKYIVEFVYLYTYELMEKTKFYLSFVILNTFLLILITVFTVVIMDFKGVLKIDLGIEGGKLEIDSRSPSN